MNGNGKKRYRRIFLIVLDSLGIGDGPDAAAFGDEGADTFGHISDRVEHLNIPNLERLGIADLKPLSKVRASGAPLGRLAALREKSSGKDTMTGHWEMMGILTTKPFITFTDTGFPPELIRALEEKTGRTVIGNKAASGTVILDELGEQEINEGKLIVYTSADSVMQICGSEEVMGLETLYRYCEIARELTMKPEWRVGRVIARPYVGRKRGEFTRTANRRDYALKPPMPTVLNALQEAGLRVAGIGKISDIFDGYGITDSQHSESSVNGMEQTIETAARDFEGLCFVNLVDFDAKWGHRRDPAGYGAEIERFDVKLGELMPLLKPDDLMILTADHGNDPTWTGTDHTREKVPMIAWSPSFREDGMRNANGNGGMLLPDRETFADLGATIAENFGLSLPDGLIGKAIGELL